MSGNKVGTQKINFQLTITDNPPVGQGSPVTLSSYASFNVIGVNDKPTFENISYTLHIYKVYHQ